MKKFPDRIFVVRNAAGDYYVSEHLKNIPIYYDDHRGIIVAIYGLDEVGKLTRELKYKKVENETEN